MAKPHNIAYTTLHNYWLGFKDPEFNTPLNDHVIEIVCRDINEWELTERHNLKRLDNLIFLLEDLYIRSKERGIVNIDWIKQLRDQFITKCLEYFNYRYEALTREYEVETKEEKKVVNVSRSHIKKYKDRIRLYSLWLKQ